jgi:hypothetical protein
MATMKDALTNFNDVINRYKVRIGALGQEREEFRTSAETKFGEIDDLIVAIESKIGNLEQRRNANEALEIENAGLLKEIDSLNEQLSKLHAKKTEIENQIAALQTENDRLNTENSTIKQQIEILNQKLVTINYDLEVKTRAIETAKAANDNLTKQITNNIELINEATQQLEQELGSLNVDNTQIDAEIIRKLEALKGRLEGMGSGSGAAAAKPIFNSDAAAAKLKAELTAQKRLIGTEIREFVKSNIGKQMPLPNTYAEYIKNGKLKTYYEALIGYTQPILRNRDYNTGVYYNEQVGGPAVRIEITLPIDEKTYNEFKSAFPHFIEYWTATELNRGGRKTIKKTKRKRKTITKGKRINKMRRTTNKRRKLRGGWTYKGSPSLDSKSSVITESNSKSSKTKSKSNKSKSNKKHKSKKVIRRYKR